MNDKIAPTLALALLLCTALVQACSGNAKAQTPGRTLNVLSYCEYSGGTGCQPMDGAPDGAELVELNWCCEFATGDCVDVASVLACDPQTEYAVICEWGASVPQSSPIGAIDCYE